MSTVAELPAESTRNPIASSLIALLVMAVAGALRFHRLGDWPFALDEIVTGAEARALFDPLVAPSDSQISRLPKIVPVGHIISWVSVSVFGADEFGSRVGPAVMGTLMVGAVFLLAEKQFGRRTATIIALLLASSPSYVFQSQVARFYSAAAFFAGMTMLLGGLAARTGAVTWIVLACTFAWVSLLTHTATIVLFPMLCLGVLAARHADTGAVHRGIVLTLSVAGILVCATVLLYVKPLIDGWNTGASWGYSVTHATLASLNILGWPMTLLAGLGLLLMFEGGRGQRWYWLCAIGAWAATTVVLPLLVPYHAWYAFPLSLSGLVLAGYAISDIYGRLRTTGRLAGVLWVGVVLGLNLPSLASHYVDGSRTDIRTAARHVTELWGSGDLVATTRVDTFRYYTEAKLPLVGLRTGDAAVPELEALTAGGHRVWVVLESTRGGLSPHLHRWLLANTRHRFRVSRKRFDYYENAVDVYMFDRGAQPGR
jgi:4-amino-4-deoxy-L-arabinose transferase-like glycosyltransferase